MNKIIRVIVSSLFLFFVAQSAFAEIERVSVSSAGEQGNNRSPYLRMSADGRFVAFTSRASNLVAGDTNGDIDINRGDDVFVHDRDAGITERVSVSSVGEQANDRSNRPSISADGRFVAFTSRASNLVAGDTNGDIDINRGGDVFVHDRDTGVTERVSVSSAGDQGNGNSLYPSISADGRFVAFISEAGNLVVGGTNGFRDIFVHDRDTGMTERINPSMLGNQGNGNSWPSMSADGRFVAFESGANNWVVDDTNDRGDIFVHDRNTGVTERVSVSSSGVQGGSSSYFPSISADGRVVVFTSDSKLVANDTGNPDTYVHDRLDGTTERVGEGYSVFPSISADGRFVAFFSTSGNLVSGDTNGVSDVFVYDRNTGTTKRISVTSNGEQTRFSSYNPSISADGRFVGFISTATDLVNLDNNSKYQDVFVGENSLADLNNDLISIEVRINGKARVTLGDAAQLLTGTLYEVTYKVTNHSPDHLTGVQIFEDGKLVCDVYALDPGQTKQRSRCTASRTVLSGDHHSQSIVTGNVSGSPTTLTNDTDAYYTGIDNASGELRLTHRINNMNADIESQALTLDASPASVSFKIENTGDIELYRVKTYHDPASPVNSGWDQQCFIGTLKPGQIRYCKRDITLSESGLNKAWGRAQGKSASVSPTGAINAANPTYFIVP